MPTENCTLIKGTLGTFHDVESTEDEMLEVYPHLGVCNSNRHEEAHTLHTAGRRQALFKLLSKLRNLRVSVSNVSKKVHWMLILHFSFPCTFISNNNVFICFDETSEHHRTVAVTIIQLLRMVIRMVWRSRAERALPVCVFRSWTKPALAKICCRPRLPHRPAFSLLLSCCVCSSTVRLVSQNCFLFPFCCAWIPALDALLTLFGRWFVGHPSCLSACLNVCPAWSWGQTLDSGCLCQLLTPSSYILCDRSTEVFFKGMFHILFRASESEFTFTL